MKKTHAFILALAALGAGPGAWAQDAQAGERKAQMCIGCHGIPGYQASFPEVHRVPMISGQGAKYLAAALAAYRKGERKHPTMKGIAASLSDADIADLAAFYAAQGGAAPPAKPAEPPAAVAELLKKGGCAGCHGENFSQPADAAYPKLAGQHADYLYVALKAYRAEGNPQVGRANAIMGGMIKPLSHAELKALAQYLGALPGELQTVAQSRTR